MQIYLEHMCVCDLQESKEKEEETAKERRRRKPGTERAEGRKEGNGRGATKCNKRF